MTHNIPQTQFIATSQLDYIRLVTPNISAWFDMIVDGEELLSNTYYAVHSEIIIAGLGQIILQWLRDHDRTCVPVIFRFSDDDEQDTTYISATVYHWPLATPLPDPETEFLFEGPSIILPQGQKYTIYSMGGTTDEVRLQVSLREAATGVTRNASISVHAQSDGTFSEAVIDPSGLMKEIQEIYPAIRDGWEIIYLRARHGQKSLYIYYHDNLTDAVRFDYRDRFNLPQSLWIPGRLVYKEKTSTQRARSILGPEAYDRQCVPSLKFESAPLFRSTAALVPGLLSSYDVSVGGRKIIITSSEFDYTTSQASEPDSFTLEAEYTERSSFLSIQ